MFKFAIKNLATKRIKVVLIILSILISSTVALLSYNIAQQVKDGIVGTAAYYDIIIGPSGSSTQLAMNTMFFTDTPLGTISYDNVTKLLSDERVSSAVPFAMGDSYNSAKIIGTKPEFLEGKELGKGEMFSETYEAVVGSAVAEKYNLKVGDKLITSHGLSENGETHESSPLTVTGILKSTKTAYDNAVFTDIETVWAVHNHDEHDEHENEEAYVSKNEPKNAAGHIVSNDISEQETEHEENSGVCAILVKTKGFSSYYSLVEEYSNDSSLLVINPSTVLREVLNNVDFSRKIVYILCIIILIMNIFVISTVTLLNMYDSSKEIKLMRLIGIGTLKVNILFLIQNAIIGIISLILSFAVSRLCIVLISDFVASMGIVLNAFSVYPLEYLIMAVVFLISILPTFICTINISKKDIVGN